MPYNALNYGLGLTSCTLGDYLMGMMGAIPFTCVAVYAGMVISSIKYLDTMFSHTDTLWYCIYAAFGVVCIVSCVALVRYTAAEMKAAVADAPQSPDGGDGSGASQVGCRGDDEDDFGPLDEERATLFGTFVSREAGGGGEGGEEMTSLGGSSVGVSTVPLLAPEEGEGSGPRGSMSTGSESWNGGGTGGRLRTAVDV